GDPVHHLGEPGILAVAADQLPVHDTARRYLLRPQPAADEGGRGGRVLDRLHDWSPRPAVVRTSSSPPMPPVSAGSSRRPVGTAMSRLGCPRRMAAASSGLYA